MVTVEHDDAGLTVRVPRRWALAFSALIEDGSGVRRLSPADTDFRQRVAAAIIHETAELLRMRPDRPPRP